MSDFEPFQRLVPHLRAPFGAAARLRAGEKGLSGDIDAAAKHLGDVLSGCREAMKHDKSLPRVEIDEVLTALLNELAAKCFTHERWQGRAFGCGTAPTHLLGAKVAWAMATLEPKGNLQLALVYYLCLRLGFEGEFADPVRAGELGTAEYHTKRFEGALTEKGWLDADLSLTVGAGEGREYVGPSRFPWPWLVVLAIGFVSLVGVVLLHHNNVKRVRDLEHHLRRSGGAGAPAKVRSIP